MDQSDTTLAHRNAQAAIAVELGGADCGPVNGYSCRPKESFKELALPLTRWQLMELEKAASDLGLTMGQLLRRLIWINLARWNEQGRRVWKGICNGEASSEQT